MSTYHITKNNFLKWYFEDGQDSENYQTKQELAELVINRLFEYDICVINTQSIFNECNQDAIQISYLEEFKDLDIHTELGDYEPNFELILID